MGTKTVADLLGFDPNAGPKAPNPVAERDIVSLDGAAIIRPDTRRGDREQLTQVTTVSAYTQYTSADQIQTELDANRPVNLQPGIVTLDKPITVSFNNLLRGHPEGTTINYTGTGSYAILFGESGVSLYDCYVSNFKLYGGGIRIDKAGPASAISNVDVYNAPEHGFFFNGATYAGERISLYSCSATGCAGDGLHVVGYDLHGFLANKFTASQNMQHGIYLDASSSAVGNSINNAISNCTVTYNCQDGVTDSEIFIYGYIGNSVV